MGSRGFDLTLSRHRLGPFAGYAILRDLLEGFRQTAGDVPDGIIKHLDCEGYVVVKHLLGYYLALPRVFHHRINGYMDDVAFASGLDGLFIRCSFHCWVHMFQVGRGSFPAGLFAPDGLPIEILCPSQGVDISWFAMADGGLLLIFRGMSTEDLLALKDKMTKQFLALGPYSGQTVGSKSWTKDARGLQSQMEAIQFVLNERGAAGGMGYEPYFIIDFSQGQPAGQPAGSTDQLTY